MTASSDEKFIQRLLSDLRALLDAKLASVGGMSPEIKKQADSQAKAEKLQEEALKTALDWRKKTSETLPDTAATAAESRMLKAKSIEDEIERQSALTQAFEYGTEQRKVIESAFSEYSSVMLAKAAREKEGALEGQLREWKDFVAQLDQISKSWLSSFTDQLLNFTLTGKTNFAGFAESVLRDILKIQYQAMVATAASGLSSGLGSLLGGIGDAFAGAFLGGVKVADPYVRPVVTVEPLMAPAFHTGGVAGVETYMARQVPISAFENAQSFSNAGIAGLGSDEVPAILQRGEGVFTKGQMEAMGGGQGVSVQVNVVNQSGQPVSAEQGQPRFDGEKMILDVVLKAASRPGMFRDGMKGAMR